MTELNTRSPRKLFPVVNELPHRTEQIQAIHEGGMLLMNKPLEWTSFDIVKFVRSRLKIKKVGHAGTLDPLATGLLICCLGKATKTIQQIQEMAKEYRAVIRLGASTPSYDRGTPPDATGSYAFVTRELVEKTILEHFQGELLQVPPIYSALKIDGERLYKKARRGEHVDIPARPVLVHSIKLTKFQLPDLHVTIECSKGTYIRSIANDLGERLGSKAHLHALERTATGRYSVEHAWTPEQFQTFLEEGP